MENLLYPKNDADRQADVKPKDRDGRDGRSAYRRDWARLIHSACFRRLQGKMQLFPSDENDFFRNRLTHSLEVGQIASGIALDFNKHEKFFKQNPIDVDLVYFAGLGHDLGHPPFGHNGEKALDRLMMRSGGFEGNGQTLRILSRLEKKDTGTFPKTRFPSPVTKNIDNRFGLNLTYRSLASVLKYDKEIPRVAEARADSDRKKPIKGYYFTESDLVKDIKDRILGAEIAGQITGFKTIECSIMDIADDIAYSTYDLEDSLKAGFISPLKILSFDNKFKSRIVDTVNDKIKTNYENIYKDHQLTVVDFNNIVVTSFENIFNISSELKAKYPSDTNISDDILHDVSIIASAQTSSASAALCESGYLRGEFTSELVAEFMGAIKVDINNYPQISKAYFDIETYKKVELLKTICYNSIISSPRLKIAERRGGAIIKCIFNTLADEREGRRLLPEDWADVYFGFTSDEMRKRTICDFIASMTDRYCVEFYSRIVGLNPPSIHKPY